MSEAEFWHLTPYQLNERIKAASEANLTQAWWVERFAREERLQSPQHYIDSMLKPEDPSLAEAMARAEFLRLAASKGIEVVAAPDSTL